MQEHPSVTEIMDEIRQGLSDNSLSDATKAQSELLARDQISLREAHAHAPVLGRCGGSLSGRLCKLLSPFAKPVIEQVDLFHAAVIRLLERLAADAECHANMRSKVEELEKRLRHIEEHTKRDM